MVNLWNAAAVSGKSSLISMNPRTRSSFTSTQFSVSRNCKFKQSLKCIITLKFIEICLTIYLPAISSGLFSNYVISRVANNEIGIWNILSLFGWTEFPSPGTTFALFLSYLFYSSIFWFPIRIGWNMAIIRGANLSMKSRRLLDDASQAAPSKLGLINFVKQWDSFYGLLCKLVYFDYKGLTSNQVIKKNYWN